MPRTIAVGDIHGCLREFEILLDQLNLRADDALITLGDYVDKGPDSRGVLDRMIRLRDECVLVPILGNHDENMLEACRGGERLENWLRVGGDAALASYGKKATLSDVPAAHFDFLQACRDYYETDTHIFTHANYDPELPFAEQSSRTLRYLSLKRSIPGPHISGKVVVVGHTNQVDVLNLGHLLCIDTGCCYGRKLTAYEVEEQRLWQVPAVSEKSQKA